MCRRLGRLSMTAGFLGLLVVGLLLAPAPPVAAHESPSGCDGNGIGSTFSRAPTGAVIHGSVITYTITISNSATGCDITGLNASITLPSGSVITVATNADLPQGDSFTCPNAAEPRCVTAGPYSYTVAHADEKAITSGPGVCPPTFGPGTAVTAIYLSSGTLHDNAVQDDPTGDCKSVTNNVEHPNLSVQKTTSTPTISAGEQASYTVTVVNNGPNTALNVVLDDTLPGTGWSITGPTSSGVVANLTCLPFDGQHLHCTADSMAALSSFSLTVTRTTTPGDCPSIQNTAVVSAANEGTNQGDNTSGPIQITVNCPDVTVTKAAAQITISAGDQATYTVTVTNNGPGDAANVTLTDTVPSSVAAPGWTVGGANAASCSPNPVAGGALLTCNFGTVAAGQSRTITLTATTTPANCPVINNSAHVAASNEAAAQQGNNNAGPVPINVNCPPDLHIVKTPDGTTYNAGDTIHFTIVVSNNGPGTAINVRFSPLDTLPDPNGTLNWGPTNPTVTCTAHSGATCTVSAVSPGVPNSQTQSCSFGNIAAGESCTVTVDSATQADQP